MSLDQPEPFVKRQTTRSDAFLDGRLAIVQKLKGFRAGLDSVLLGAAVGPGPRRLLDLGAGVGTAALVALAHDQRLTAVLAERDPEAAALARENVAANGFAARAGVVEGDVLVPGGAALELAAFDAVIANPPYFDAARATLPQESDRAGARHAAQGGIEDWVKAAARALASRGRVVFVYPADGLAPLLAAMTRRFGDIDILPLAPRPGAPATRVLVRGVRDSRAPLSLLATRDLHGAEGNGFAPEFEAILRGRAVLDW